MMMMNDYSSMVDEFEDNGEREDSQISGCLGDDDDDDDDDGGRDVKVMLHKVVVSR